ncbi:MAG: endolytic transglycosylase MltG [Desulfobacteraceae bacterium]|nr:endolytic transglycosylase MltG [Desulfobacteraceae bacterium]
MKHLSIIALSVLMAAVMAVVIAYVDIHAWAQRPAAGKDPRERIVSVERGQRLRSTAEVLHRQGIVDDPLRFRVLARLEGLENTIQAGEYALSPAMAPLQVLRILVEGRVVLHRLTVPEGLRIRQIAQLAAAAGLVEAEEFIAAATDPEMARSLGIPADSLEGYLFPETYFFPGSATARDLCRTMVNRFHTVFSDAWRQRADQIGFSVHEIVTLASIIEKETAMPSERAAISSVFHNRLRRGMRLETDPTVIYGIENFDGNLTRKDLRAGTPYNTYVIRGLPPGPIANPGKAALEAALFPADTNYLYFVAKNDGTHAFSATLREHNRAVRRYQKGG